MFSVVEDTPVDDPSPLSWKRRPIVHPPRASRGVRVEGYQLSKQAGQLTAEGLLISPTLNRRTRVGRIVSLDALRAARIDEWDCVSLNGSVLLRGEEASVVDAHMFAVSVPVESVSFDEKYCVSTDNPFYSSLGPARFPTTTDMYKDSVASIAKNVLVRLVRDVSVSAPKGPRSRSLSVELGNRLRDPHLLLYLSSLLGDRDMRLLCTALTRRGPVILPNSLVMSLEQVALSLSPANSLEVNGEEDDDR